MNRRTFVQRTSALMASVCAYAVHGPRLVAFASDQPCPTVTHIAPVANYFNRSDCAFCYGSYTSSKSYRSYCSVDSPNSRIDPAPPEMIVYYVNCEVIAYVDPCTNDAFRALGVACNNGQCSCTISE